PAFGDIGLPWYLRLLGWLLSLAETPHTVAVIPDGNRRYARAKGRSIHEGHNEGLSQLEKATAAPSFGIRRLVTFLLSVNNFNRTEEEKSHLYALISSTLRNICKSCMRYRERGQRVRCVGDLEMLPRDIQRHAADAELSTRHNRQ
ncbi:cis-prenyltransferase, putative, partial [Ixodes scapularis]